MSENTTQSEVNEQAHEGSAQTETTSKGGSTSTIIKLNGGNLNTSLDAEKTLKNWPKFNVGDNVKVHYRIVEGDKQRIQVYEGTVISIRGEGLGKTFIVRRISHEIGVERIFPYHTPSIAKIEVVRYGKVRRGKLFYLRHKSGKAGRIKESMKSYAKAQEAAGPAAKKKGKKKKAEAAG